MLIDAPDCCFEGMDVGLPVPESEPVVVDFLLTKTLDALTAWYNGNKDRKENAAQLLLELRRLMNKPLLHMNLSKKHGHVMIGTYALYLERDIEKLDDFISLHAPEIEGDLIASVAGFRDYLVEVYSFLKSAGLGCAVGLNTYLDGTKKYVEETSAKIDALLSEH